MGKRKLVKIHDSRNITEILITFYYSVIYYIFKLEHLKKWRVIQ